jgi:hypothetical protein
VGLDINPNGYISMCAVAKAASMASPDAMRGISSATRSARRAEEMPALAPARTTKYYWVVG